MTPLLESWTQPELMALRPPARISVSEWAQRFRELDRGSSARPGRWRNEITPYAVEVMDAFSDPDVEEVTVMMPAQSAKTEILINAMGYAVDQDPDPILVVRVDEDDYKDFNVNRVQPAFRATRAITRHRTGEKRDWTNSHLKFHHCLVRFASSHSATDLAGKPIRWLFLDETDKMPTFVGREASPLRLARKRTKTYPDRKIGKFCTPTREDGLIYKEYLAGDQREYWVPCPKCGVFQLLDLEHLQVPEKLKDKPQEVRRKSAAWYQCPHCNAKLKDNGENLRFMLERGRWVPKACKISADGKEITGRTDSPHRSYHINGLYSPFMSWSDIAAEHIETRDDPEAEMDFMNSTMGLPYKEVEKAISGDLIDSLKDDRAAGVVPNSAIVLTGFADVGGPIDGPWKFEWVVRAWGEGFRSWGVAYGTIEVPSNVEEPFDQLLEEVIYRPWEDGIGHHHFIERFLVDDGWNTEKVKDWCSGHDPIVHPAKGIPYQHVPISIRHEDDLEIRNVDVNAIKDHLYSLMLLKSDHRSRWTVHRDVCEKYKKHMATERLTKVTRLPGTKAGKRKRIWVRQKGAGSPHWWDGEVGCLAAARDLGLNRSLKADGDRPRPPWADQPKGESWPEERESVRARREREQDEADGWFDDIGEDFL